LDVRLHEGRNLHTLTGADTIKTYASVRDRADCLKASLSFVNLLNRATPELEKRPRTFNLVKKFLESMDSTSGGSTGSATLLSLAAQLKFILLAGYLPRLSSCAVCGREGDHTRFSAAAGGVLCPQCDWTSFKVRPETLATTRRLLAKPLDDALPLSADSKTEREIWQIIHETCRYHLGVDLKVEPWI
ncbi:MAG: DNA repair protein RecO, partial [Actinomycetota bacterium]